ncbi:MAG: hypothetical protein PHT15_06000, partial [Gallionellaceae bacterium]|nr:hypothetical protein [Gallionellaceae bacterium]
KRTVSKQDHRQLHIRVLGWANFITCKEVLECGMMSHPLVRHIVVKANYLVQHVVMPEPQYIALLPIIDLAAHRNRDRGGQIA